MQKYIGVTGCVVDLPPAFPLQRQENAGNMIHGHVPLKLFANALHFQQGTYKLFGAQTFFEFVNHSCSHLIMTMANSLTLNDDSAPVREKYRRLRESIQRYHVPIVVFGLGLSLKTFDPQATLVPEGQLFFQELASRGAYLGVRGEYTAEILERTCGIKNIYVTGCPSLYAYPDALLQVAENAATLRGTPACSVTYLRDEREQDILYRAFQQGHFFVSTVCRPSHEYFCSVWREPTPPPPHYWQRLQQQQPAMTPAAIAEFYRRNYRLFRNVPDWLNFYRECVSYSYGTRFHANMAAVLAGTPAIWLTHDARTEELTRYHHLPRLTLDEFMARPTDEHLQEKLAAYATFTAHVPAQFARFQAYLAAHGLPPVIRSPVE